MSPRPARRGHELLPHTADLRAALWAADLPGLYDQAAEQVRQILVGASPVAPREERLVACAGDDDAERFFRFVRELLYLYDTEAFLPARVVAGGSGAPPRVAGERFDAARHVSERQVKAVTRHGYRFRRSPAGYEAELVFDL